MFSHTIHFTRFVRRGAFGDFSKMILDTPAYFIFNDNTRDLDGFGVGGGSAAIRPYKYGNPDEASLPPHKGVSFGFPTGPPSGGFTSITLEVRRVTRNACDDLRMLLDEGTPVDIYISVGDDNMIGKGIFPELSDDVRRYITEAIIDTVVKSCDQRRYPDPKLRYYALDGTVISGT